MSISLSACIGIHYLAILWAAALMAHAPQRIFWLVGVPLLTYITDVIIGYNKTHLLDNTYFERVGKDTVLVTFETPDGMAKSKSSSFVYVMIPWISKYQWHAFSVYDSKKPGHSQLCITKASKGALNRKSNAASVKSIAQLVRSLSHRVMDCRFDRRNVRAKPSAHVRHPSIPLALQFARHGLDKSHRDGKRNRWVIFLDCGVATQKLSQRSFFCQESHRSCLLSRTTPELSGVWT